jgi:anti-anti-sigma factor
VAHTAHEVIIDCSAVTYIDSTVLTQLLRLLERMHKRGTGAVVLRNLPPRVMRIFTVAGVAGLFKFRSGPTG